MDKKLQVVQFPTSPLPDSALKIYWLSSAKDMLFSHGPQCMHSYLFVNYIIFCAQFSMLTQLNSFCYWSCKCSVCQIKVTNAVVAREATQLTGWTNNTDWQASALTYWVNFPEPFVNYSRKKVFCEEDMCFFFFLRFFAKEIWSA